MSSSPDPSGEPANPTQLGLDPALERAGFNLAGVLTVERYNALVTPPWQSQALHPSANSVVVLATGGMAFFEAAMARGEQVGHPLDQFCQEVVRAAADRWTGQGARTIALFYWERRRLDLERRRDPGSRAGARADFADFVALARSAGLGAPSRLGQLLHPHYGPWFGIRALLLSERRLDEAIAVRSAHGGGFAPCTACPAPCVTACHGAAISPPGGASDLGTAFSVARCGEARRSPQTSCATRCDARRACPVGRERAYSSEAVAYHMRASFNDTGEITSSPGGSAIET